MALDVDADALTACASREMAIHCSGAKRPMNWPRRGANPPFPSEFKCARAPEQAPPVPAQSRRLQHPSRNADSQRQAPANPVRVPFANTRSLLFALLGPSYVRRLPPSPRARLPALHYLCRPLRLPGTLPRIPPDLRHRDVHQPRPLPNRRPPLGGRPDPRAVPRHHTSAG